MTLSRLSAVGLVLLLAVHAASHGQAIVSFEVDKINGVPLPGGPSATVSAWPGDVLELIFRVRNWGTVPPPNQLKGYQCSVRFEEYFNDCSGDVLPVEFYQLTDPQHVCPDGDPIGGNSFAYVFIDTARPDFVFSGNGTSFVTTSTNGCDYRLAGALLNTVMAQGDGPAYLGTIVVRVSDDAVGTFVVDPNPDTIDGTFLRNQNNMPLEPVAFEGCTINVGDICIPVYNPLHIDARQPHSIINANDRQGLDRITMHFDLGCEQPFTEDDEFVVTVEPTGGAVPQVVEVIADCEDVTIVFDSIIPAGKWTRVARVSDGQDVCVGFLPGDVNNDRTASPVDILKLLDHLNGIETFDIVQTDIDRSGVTNPADVLRVIDLLNGADAFEVWNGRTLPPSPCN